MFEYFLKLPFPQLEGWTDMENGLANDPNNLFKSSKMLLSKKSLQAILHKSLPFNL